MGVTGPALTPAIHTAMVKRINIPLEAVALAALLALFGLSVFAAPTNEAPDRVLLTGWLHVEDRTVEDLVLVVELDGEHCLYAEVRGSGRFIVEVPANSRAVLRFDKPGHLSKEVVVDTRNALASSKAQRANRRIDFDVVLEPEEKRPGRRYDGPVGSLRFVKGTGSMKVGHDLRVVAAEALAP